MIIHCIRPSLNETIDSEFISFISMRLNNNHFALSYRVFGVNLLPHACSKHAHTCIMCTEVNRSPHQNDFNCCRLRNIEKKNTYSVVVCASVLFPYGYVFFPFCYSAIDLTVFHLPSQSVWWKSFLNGFRMQFIRNKCE